MKNQTDKKKSGGLLWLLGLAGIGVAVGVAFSRHKRADHTPEKFIKAEQRLLADLPRFIAILEKRQLKQEGGQWAATEAMLQRYRHKLGVLQKAQSYDDVETRRQMYSIEISFESLEDQDSN